MDVPPAAPALVDDIASSGTVSSWDTASEVICTTLAEIFTAYNERLEQGLKDFASTGRVTEASTAAPAGSSAEIEATTADSPGNGSVASIENGKTPEDHAVDAVSRPAEAEATNGDNTTPDGEGATPPSSVASGLADLIDNIDDTDSNGSDNSTDNKENVAAVQNEEVKEGDGDSSSSDKQKPASGVEAYAIHRKDATDDSVPAIKATQDEILAMVKAFPQAPFTVQRLCEVLRDPCRLLSVPPQSNTNSTRCILIQCILWGCGHRQGQVLCRRATPSLLLDSSPTVTLVA
eukprot:m.263900 g.263900  ORF g.263900 m.263900 type:complete len:291 (-) comp19713_c0_seq4:712-1584(-)